MKRLSTAILSCVLAPLAIAANTATLSWTAPTSDSEGTPLPAGTSITYTIYQGVGTGSTKTKVGTSSTTGYSITSGLNANSTYCWQITANATGFTESGMSTEACKTFPPAQMSAPTGLTAR